MRNQNRKDNILKLQKDSLRKITQTVLLITIT